MVTPLISTDALDAATLNARLDELQAAIDALRIGATATSINASTFVNAQHHHQNSDGGGILYPAAISSSGYAAGQVMSADGSGGWWALSLFQIPPGVVVPYGGVSAPSGWLFAAGQVVSRTTYASLFAVIGTTFGAGDGISLFNLPYLNGRVPIGKDNMNGTNADVILDSWAEILGGTGGAATHNLTISEMPYHSHATGVATANYGYGGNTAIADGMGGAVGFNGGGQPHNNIQPSIAMNWIIKT